MPKHLDMCRSCGAKVVLDPDHDDLEKPGFVLGEVCAGCGKTVCVNSCKRNSCPHADLPPNKSSVSAEQHQALQDQFNDPDALRAQLAKLMAAKGETLVGV